MCVFYMSYILILKGLLNGVPSNPNLTKSEGFHLLGCLKATTKLCALPSERRVEWLHNVIRWFVNLKSAFSHY